MNIKKTKIEDYIYQLNDNRIAKYPINKRENSKLLICNKDEIYHKNFSDLPELFNKNELLVFNNTKVIQARLHFYKSTGAKIEVFCLDPINPTDYNLVFQSNKQCEWKCIVGNLKKWKTGILTNEISVRNIKVSLNAEKIRQEGNSVIIKFSWNNTDFTFGEILENTGQTPIPPYLNRKSEISDKKRYQTVYSKFKGSVAAPTAGLHFTDNILSNLLSKGILTENITLHVGAGTFKPVKTGTIGEHEMHSEHFSVSKKSIKNIIENIDSITAVGTTTVRTLESLYWLGVKIITNNNLDNFYINQWEVYEYEQNIKPIDALTALKNHIIDSGNKTLNSKTQIIIVPGYKFRLVKKLITNFHQPKSTLLLLIAAFIGNKWKEIYNYAIENNFRFLSYGDSSLLIK